MSKRCGSCVYRGDSAGCGSACLYILHTGCSRLKEAYKATGESSLTDRVREAMRPENCGHYKKGKRQQLPEAQILLPGTQIGAKPQLADLPVDGPSASSGKCRPNKVRPLEPQLRALHRKGLTDPEIGKALDLSGKTVCAWRHRVGLQPNKYIRPKKPLTSTVRQEPRMRELYEQGWSDRKIGRAVGLSEETVAAWRKRTGLPSHYRKPQAEERDGVL